MKNPIVALAIATVMFLTADVFVRREKSLALAFVKAAGWR